MDMPETPVEEAIQRLCYNIAKDAAIVTAPQNGDGIAYCMLLQMAALMAYDGERLIRLLESEDLLMPREMAQPYIDLLTELLNGDMVTS